METFAFFVEQKNRTQHAFDLGFESHEQLFKRATKWSALSDHLDHIGLFRAQLLGKCPFGDVLDGADELLASNIAGVDGVNRAVQVANGAQGRVGSQNEFERSARLKHSFVIRVKQFTVVRMNQCEEFLVSSRTRCGVTPQQTEHFPGPVTGAALRIVSPVADAGVGLGHFKRLLVSAQSCKIAFPLGLQ